MRHLLQQPWEDLDVKSLKDIDFCIDGKMGMGEKTFFKKCQTDFSGKESSTHIPPLA